MDYSYAYAKRRGLVGGNPTMRYEKHYGKFVVAGDVFYPGRMVRVIGNDPYVIGGGQPVYGVYKILKEYIPCPSERNRILTDNRYVNKRMWRLDFQGISHFNWIYWEHDLEII